MSPARPSVIGSPQPPAPSPTRRAAREMTDSCRHSQAAPTFVSRGEFHLEEVLQAPSPNCPNTGLSGHDVSVRLHTPRLPPRRPPRLPPRRSPKALATSAPAAKWSARRRGAALTEARVHPGSPLLREALRCSARLSAAPRSSPLLREALRCFAELPRAPRSPGREDRSRTPPRRAWPCPW